MSTVVVGQKLRHYRIETKLGQGGMGIVYRARDTHLDRSIALKVLPASDISDPDRRSRLAQEARAASALNHPNIVTIYDIGTDGDQNERVDFIAMEFVQGKTLDRLIGRRGMKTVDALRFAVQVADAIGAAHANGIIHRDLKPANLMITDQGLVKVLDFGLAKSSTQKNADVFAATESVHLAPDAITETGSIVGTVAYMSPEQAEGKQIDARSDIFSFGSVLYEMVTGTRPFQGDSKLSVLATILQKEPRPAAELAQGIPRELERIINRCLQKDARDRWQTMSDVKFALEDLLADMESNRLSQAAAAAPQARLRGRLLWVMLALLVAVAGGAAFLALKLRHVEPVSYQRLTFRRGDVNGARFTPDGQTVVYSAAWDGARSQIFTMQPGSHESRALDLPEGHVLAVSSTGELAFLRGSATPGVLARVPLAGGAPRDVLENVLDAEWSPDGTQLAVVRAVNGRIRLEYPIGQVLYETDRQPPLSPRLSPKGDLIAFYEYDTQTGDYGVAVLGPHSPKRLLSTGWRGISDHLDWSPNGKEVWFAATHLSGDPALHAVDLEGHDRVVAQIPGWLTIQDITRDGKLLLTSATTRIAITFVPPDNRPEEDLSWLDTSRVFALSDDGKLLMFVELSYGDDQNTSIYIRKTDGSPAILVGYGNHPALSPDGKWVAAISTSAKNLSGLVLLPTGAGEQRTLTIPGMHYDYVEWFPSSNKLLFMASKAGHHAMAYVQDLSNASFKPVTKEGVRAQCISPDGASAIVNDGAKYLRYSLKSGGSQPLPGIEPGDRPLRWASDGEHVFIQRAADNGPRTQIYRVDVATGKREFWKELGPSDPVGAQMMSVAMTPDGKSYAYSYQRDTANLYLVRGAK